MDADALVRLLIDIVDDLVGGAVRVSWGKLSAYAERLESERGCIDALEGAHVRHRAWHP